MSTIARGAKAAGGLNFTPGTTILSYEVDTDFNTIYNDYNGGILNININGSANIDPTKVDNLASQTTTTDPYPGAVATPATNLPQEIQQLRYLIAQITGQANWYVDPASNISALPNSQNLLRNAGFESYVGATSIPVGWTDSGGGSTYSHDPVGVDATDESEGEGREITISGANGGLDQTLAGLKAGTTYAVVISGKIAGAGTGTAATTGATTNLSLAWTAADTTYVRRYGTVVTDATGTNVVLSLRRTAGSMSFDNCSFVELGNLFLGASPGTVTAYRRHSTAGAAIVVTTEAHILNGAGDNLIRDVYVPGPGYYIRVTAKVWGIVFDNADIWTFRMRENNSAPGTAATGTVVDVALHGPTPNNNEQLTLSMMYVDEAPTPGQHYYYHVSAHATTNDGTPSFTPQSGALGYSHILIEVLPYG